MCRWTGVCTAKGKQKLRCWLDRYGRNQPPLDHRSVLDDFVLAGFVSLFSSVHFLLKKTTFYSSDRRLIRLLRTVAAVIEAHGHRAINKINLQYHLSRRLLPRVYMVDIYFFCWLPHGTLLLCWVAIDKSTVQMLFWSVFVFEYPKASDFPVRKLNPSSLFALLLLRSSSDFLSLAALLPLLPGFYSPGRSSVSPSHRCLVSLSPTTSLHQRTPHNCVSSSPPHCVCIIVTSSKAKCCAAGREVLHRAAEHG